jgi:hypothetical protein
MLSSSRFNYLIEITQKLILAVDRMRDAYRSFPKLIAEEHKMVLSHTYTQRLEEICAEKSVLADDITAAFEEILQLAQQVFNIWGDAECEGSASYPGDLSNCVRMLEGILRSVRERGQGMGPEVLALQIDRLKESVDTFKSVATEVKPLVELNRSALSGVVRSYQESTRVLFELCEQAQATYSPQGVQTKAATGTSTIFVRA